MMIYDDDFILGDDSLVLGIDEAGRGSVLGPLVVGAVLVPRKKLRFLKRMGVKDSKKLTSKRRTVIARKIKKLTTFTTRIIPAEKIDEMRLNSINLNQIETNAMEDIIGELMPDACIIDCIESNEDKFTETIEEFIKTIQKPDMPIQIMTKHKADEKYDIVSAASIIAKTTRDKELEKIRSEYGKLGSGYPSDPVTRNYLKTLDEDNYPWFVRKTWNTIDSIQHENHEEK